MEKANSQQFGSAVHAAKRAADLIFALQNEDLPDEKLVDQLNDILAKYGEQAPEVVIADLDDLKLVSKKLYAIFEAKNTTEAARTLNLALSEFTYAPRLSAHAGAPWHLHVDSNDHASWAEWFAASSALALATLLAEKQRNPSGICASAACERPFIDLGKGGRRSYCSPKCATRVRVAAFRNKHAGTL